MPPRKDISITSIFQKFWPCKTRTHSKQSSPDPNINCGPSREISKQAVMNIGSDSRITASPISVRCQGQMKSRAILGSLSNRTVHLYPFGGIVGFANEPGDRRQKFVCLKESLGRGKGRLSLLQRQSCRMRMLYAGGRASTRCCIPSMSRLFWSHAQASILRSVPSCNLFATIL